MRDNVHNQDKLKKEKGKLNQNQSQQNYFGINDFPCHPITAWRRGKKKKKKFITVKFYGTAVRVPPPYLRGKIFKGCNFKNYLVFIGRITKFGNKLVQE